jgi:type IV secretory pathway VirB4 component
MVTRAWTHWATSADLDSLRVPAHDAGTSLTGRPLGRVQHGPAFVLDPFDAYAAGLVSNPNVVVAGSIGAGKSTVVKMIIDRALERGRRVVVVDPKGEYGELGRSHGARTVALGRDGWCDPFPTDPRDGRDLVIALLGAARGSPLTSDEHYVIDLADRALAPTTSGSRLASLFAVFEPDLASNATSSRRDLALLLYRFARGDLAGLFSGDGDPLDFSGQLVVIDLSAQWSSSSFHVAALSAVAAAQRVVVEEGSARYLVLDEAWAMLNDEQTLRWLQGSWKLARSRGLSHILVLHRWTDVASVGDVGSASRERARGLLRECETSLLFRQPPDEARDMAVALDLRQIEERYLTALPKGVALVRFGEHRSVVQIVPDERDRRFIDTDAAMRASQW